jgi:hypothetical protein
MTTLSAVVDSVVVRTPTNHHKSPRFRLAARRVRRPNAVGLCSMIRFFVSEKHEVTGSCPVPGTSIRTRYLAQASAASLVFLWVFAPCMPVPHSDALPFFSIAARLRSICGSL